MCGAGFGCLKCLRRDFACPKWLERTGGRDFFMRVFCTRTRGQQASHSAVLFQDKWTADCVKCCRCCRRRQQGMPALSQTRQKSDAHTVATPDLEGRKGSLHVLRSRGTRRPACALQHNGTLLHGQRRLEKHSCEFHSTHT